jgi:hypothetical protein
MLSFAQFNSEAELKKEAEKLFLEKKYTEAMPLFGQLASIYSKDANYNFKYGACLIFGDRDKEKPLRFLRFAVSKPDVDPLAYFFMGKVLHLNYYFKEAIENYTKYIAKAPAKSRAEYNVEREIEMCRNGIKLLSDIKDIDVVGKKETRKDEFYRTYDLKGIGGKIVAKPEEFRSKFDKKINDYSVIYLPQNLQNEVFFASYGEDGKSGKDIYKVLRLPNGEWGKPVSIGEPINTPFDEDFPFMHPDGKTLYFSSKGHNSMGGYDIFKTIYDEKTSTWSTPKNLDFAYSSPDDDFFFVTDEEMSLAYFASSRASKEGDITVYRVKVQPKAADFVIIKGEFINESNEQMRTAKVTVTDLANNQNMGEYFTNTTNGKYAILLPGKGGKYKFAIETTETAPIHSGMVEVPRQENEVVALKQELRLVGKGDNEKLVIKNLFDQTEEFDVNDPLLVESIIRQKAKLDVNATEAQVLASIQQLQENKNNNNDTTPTENIDEFKNLSNNEIAEKAKIIEKELKQKIDAIQNEANYAYSVSNGKSKQAKENSEKADKIKSSLASFSATDRTIKENEAQQLKEEARKLTNEALAARKIAATLDNDVAELTSEYNNVSQLVSAIQFDISANNRGAAVDKLRKQNELIAAINQTPTSKTIEKSALADKVNKSKNETQKVESNLNDLSQRKTEIEEEIQQLNTQLTAAKKKDKEAIEAKLKALEIDKEDIAYQYEDEQKKLNTLRKESEIAETELRQYEVLSKQVEENKTIVSAPTLQQKTETETNIARLEEKGLSGTSPNTKTEEKLSESKVNEFDLIALKNDYNIITDDGKIKNYNNEFSNQLAEADKITNTDLRNEKIAEINKNWANTIQQEIEITQKQLEAATSLNEKTQITSKTNKLKEFKEQKEKDANTSLALNSKANNTNQLSEEKNIKNYNEEFSNEINELNNNNSLSEKESNKIEILNRWNTAIQKDIQQNNEDLKLSKTEEEKNNIERKIIQLEEQYAQNTEQIENSKSAIALNSQNSLENKQELNNNKITENKSSFEEHSAFKYNNNTNYNNEEAKSVLLETNNLKAEAVELLSKSENLKEQAQKSNNPQEKNELNTQADELEIKSQNIELQIADKYAEANKTEYIKNKNTLNGNPFINAANKSDDATMANLMKEEADFYFNEASKIRVEINEDMYFVSKQTALQKAYDYEIKAIQKQQQAFAIANYNAVAEKNENELVNQNQNIAELNQTALNKPIETNAKEDTLKNTENNIKINEEIKLTEANKNDTITNISEYKLQEDANRLDNKNSGNRNNSLASISKTPENIQSEKLIKEAEVLEEKSAALSLQASNAKKKKEKEALVIESQRLSAEATAKRNEAAELTEIANEKIKENEQIIASTKLVQQKNTSFIANNNEQQNATSLTDSELSAINNSSAFTQYAKEKQNARRVAKEAEVEYLQVLKLTSEANDAQVKAEELKIKAENETDENEKEELLTEADKLEDIAIAKEKEASSLSESAKAKAKQITIYENSAQFAVADLASEEANKFEIVEKTAFSDAAFKSRLEKIAEVQTSLATNNQSVNLNTSESNTNVNSSNSNNSNNLAENNITQGTLTEVARMKIPEKLTSNIFVKSNTNQAAYNNSDPIPASTVEPEGLVFKVQVGAFRNPIPQDHFKGFAPIVSESGPNGITRYTAGYFKDFNIADNAKSDIRNIGYRDAFVVAFLNGKRINIDQARAMVNSNQQPITNPQLSQNNRTNTESSNRNTNESSNNANSNNTNQTTTASKPINDGFSTSVQTVKGLFYTVQVGVYSGTIKPNILNDIENINSDRLPNNLVRYSSGRYKTVEEATAVRTQIIAKGISDAFVTAYIDGQRYTVDQARRKIEQNEVNPNINTSTNDAKSNNTSNENSRTNINSNNNSTTTTNNSTKAEEKEYKVNIGEYADDIPNDVAGVYLQLTGRGIKSYEKGNKTVYIIGSFNNFEDAETLKKEMIELGLKEAKVVTYINNEEIE